MYLSIFLQCFSAWKISRIKFGKNVLSVNRTEGYKISFEDMLCSFFSCQVFVMSCKNFDHNFQWNNFDIYRTIVPYFEHCSHPSFVFYHLLSYINSFFILISSSGTWRDSN